MPPSNPEVWERLLRAEVLLTPLVSSPPKFALDPSNWNTRLDLTVAAKCALTNLQAEEAKIEYLAFLYLAFVTEDLIAPSEVVAIFWHVHMEDRASYHEFCLTYFSRKIGHSAGRPLPYADTAYARTLVRYRQEFDESPPIRFWPRQSISGFDWQLNWILGFIALAAFLGVATGAMPLISLAGCAIFLTIGIIFAARPLSTTYPLDELPNGFPPEYGQFTCNGGGCAAD